MKKGLLVSLLSLLLLLSACGTKEESSSNGEGNDKEENKVEEVSADTNQEENQSGKEEALNYLKEIQPILIKIQEVSLVYEDYRSKSANGEIDDNTFYTGISQEVLPGYIQISDDLELMMPPKEFKDAHELAIEMNNKSSQAMSEILSALDTQDMSKITSANSILADARKSERDYVYKLQEISDKYGISLEEL
jgi:ABC-type glycerol-3-phosphate transport system substrate-binding protein